MKAVLQRVTRAQVEVEGQVVGAIEQGFCVFVGVAGDDTSANAEKMAQKIAAMRIFSDENGKFNLSLADVKGSILLVSNFTLFGETRKGNRPFFGSAALPELAEELYERLATLLRAQGIPTQTGVFGAAMKVQLENDGPVTLILEF